MAGIGTMTRVPIPATKVRDECSRSSRFFVPSIHARIRQQSAAFPDYVQGFAINASKLALRLALKAEGPDNSFFALTDWHHEQLRKPENFPAWCGATYFC
jgi:hypothetical protein